MMLREAASVLASIRDSLRPRESEYDELFSKFFYVKERLVRCLSGLGTAFVVSLQGSLAKDTVLRGASDIDVFVLFDPNKVEPQWFEKVFIPRVLECFKDHRCFLEYATHPYLTVIIDGTEINIVPAYITHSDRPLTAVDRTPHHTRYIVKKLVSRERRDEVRLLKRFLKTLGIYGAEVGVKGFSGYVAELLIAYYGSFLEVLRNVLRWREGSTCIDIEKHYADPRECLARFRDAVIVVIDPVDPRRNAAAAVSQRALNVFRVGAALFLQCPSPRFFQDYSPPNDINSIRNALAQVTEAELLPVLAIYRGNAVPDVLWGEIKRVEKSVVNTLKQRNVEVVLSESWASESRAVLALLVHDSWRSYFQHQGPPTVASERVMSFIVKNADAVVGPWIDDSSLKCVKRRKRALYEEIATVVKQFSKVKHLELDRLCIGGDVLTCLESLSAEDRSRLIEAFTRKLFVWLIEPCLDAKQSL